MKKISFITFLMVIALLLTGCGGTTGGSDSDSTSATTDTSLDVAVVIGAHSNANQISFNTDDIAQILYDTAYTYGHVTFVRCDGDPEVFYSASIPESSVSGLSESKLKSIAEGYRDELLSVLSTAEAKVEEVDTLEAIRLAANALQSSDSTGDKILLVLDSGVSTTGYLNFCDLDLMNAGADQIVAKLNDEYAIPNTSGLTVVWLYCGETASPQEELSEAQKYKLREIWEAILLAGGAESVEFSLVSPSSTPYTDLPDVSVVEALPRLIVTDFDTSIKDSEETGIIDIVLDFKSVEFYGDSAEFRYPETAKENISKVAELLKEYPDKQVYVAGSTASGSDDFCQKLSEDRANAVSSLLIEYGVNEDQLITIGLGDNASWHILDLDNNGQLIEEYARLNRCVRILEVNETNTEYLSNQSN